MSALPINIHREIPQAPEAEKGVLSSLLLSPVEVRGILSDIGLTEDAFYIPAHREIYTAMLALMDAAKPLDFITLAQHFQDQGRLDQVGGGATISELFRLLPTAANAAYYADILQKKHIARRIIQTCAEFAGRAYDEQANIGGVLDEFEADALRLRPEQSEAVPTMKESVTLAVREIHRLYEQRGATTGLPTGFAQLDRLTNGLQPAEMFVIAARPSMGKTALAMNMAEHIAVEQQKAVGVFSLEMSRAQLVQRMLNSVARVDASRVRNGFLADRDFPAITAAAERLARTKVIIDDTGAITIQDLRARARRMKQRRDVVAIFVDYLQLIRSNSKRAERSREQEVSEISSGLKAMAKELNIPVVVLAQLNRNPEGRTGDQKGRPRLSDLRDSGTIEQDADVVGLLVRDEYYATAEEKAEVAGKATLIIAKQRNGPTDDVPLTFLKEFARFENRSFDAE